MSEWVLRPRDLKRYPHFDQHISRVELEAIVRDPERVRTNRFFPFLLYEKEFQPFRLNGKPKKVRPIRYASRRDSVIFSYYRHILSERYEAELKRLAIGDSVIAYRKITGGPDNRGKCNIHFARDAFDYIIAAGDCCGVALDISKYFETIDHARLRSLWCRMLGTNRLPADQATVFRNITKYAVVNRLQAYERLGYFGPKIENGKTVRGYLVPFDEMPTQLCAPPVFREKIIGGSAMYPTLLRKNENPYGIPQGASISDLLANLYLLDFDTEMVAYAKSRNALYLRYSDEILFVVPGGAQEGIDARDMAIERIQTFGDQIKIKPEKCCIVRYWSGNSDHQQFERVDGLQGRNGTEYLGFRFDGRHVFLRDSTVSGFYRKIARAAQAAARSHVSRFQGKSLPYLLENFDFEAFTKQFGRVEDFDENDDYRSWTFWTYAKRAAEAFGKRGLPILGQMKNHREKIRSRVTNAIARAHDKQLG